MADGCLPRCRTLARKRLLCIHADRALAHRDTYTTMNRAHLGDSCDAIKRLWQSIFAPFAPIFAEPRFIAEELRLPYTGMTRVPKIPEARPPQLFSLLLDPDIGIVVPGGRSRGEPLHITIDDVLALLHEHEPVCLITYDQGFSRHNQWDRRRHLLSKRQALIAGGATSFYYDSHAVFWFTFHNDEAKFQVHDLLVGAGIPNERLIW